MSLLHLEDWQLPAQGAAWGHRVMSLFDWVFPLILIPSVVRQRRGEHLGTFALAWPLAIVIWAPLTSCLMANEKKARCRSALT